MLRLSEPPKTYAFPQKPIPSPSVSRACGSRPRFPSLLLRAVNRWGCKLKYRLGFSIVASFSGEHPDLSEWWPCETTLSDVLKYWPGGEVEPSEPFDSEYSYLAREGSLSREILDRLDDARGETRFQICRKLKEKFGSEAFWACISDVQMSGVFDRQTAFKFLDSIGAGFEDCGTMGTIGGPLGHWCPDFAFNVESQALISSIRITPILCAVSESGELEPVRPPSEWQWDRFKDLFKRFDCFDLARQGRAIDAH